MTTLPPDRIYKGYWVNHAEGPVFGATITLPTRGASVLVAGMSLLIAIAGEHLWGIMTFTYYSLRAADSPQDRLFYHRQFILRNLATPGSALLRVVTLYWNSRKYVNDALLRLMTTALLATTCGVVIVVASTLSSQIMKTSDIEVLVRSQSCGFVDNTADVWYNYLITAAAQGLRYSRSCYNESAADPAGRSYVTHGILFDTTYVPCPFEDLCALSENAAIQMDTGPLNSNTIFGMNANSNDSINLRKITTCAPLNLSRYEAIEDMDDAHARVLWDRPHLPGEQMLTWNIGRRVLSADFNQTLFPQSSFMSMLQLYTSSIYVPKCLSYYPPAAFPAGGNFDPIAPFAREDADTVVVLIGLGTTTYDQPVDDPVFAAHQNAASVTPWATYSGSSGGFKSDNPAGAIGCFEQYQMCLPNGKCTVPGGLNRLALESFALELTGLQNATLFLFGWPLITIGLDIGIINGLSPSETLAATRKAHVWPFSLPPNQWEIEVKSWEAMVLTQIQKFASDVVVGADVSGTEFESIPLLPAGPAERTMCHSQKMIAPAGFSNISVFGLALTVSACVLVTLVNLMLTKTLRRLKQPKLNSATTLEQWDEDDMLYVQRKLLEVRGVHDWSTVKSRATIATGDAALVCRRPDSLMSPAKDEKLMTGSVVVVSEVVPRECVKDGLEFESTRLLENDS